MGAAPAIASPAPVPVRGLLFDAMGTLIGLRASVGSTYATAAAGHGLELDAAAIDRAFGPVLRQASPLAFPGLEGPALLEAERHWWGDRIDETLRAAGGGPTPEALRHELFERYADPTLWRVYPGVSEQLERWNARGLALAVVSNFDSRLLPLLEGLGLAPWFKAVVVSSAAGAAKPDPLPFQRALKALGLEPPQVWHVGDSPEDEAGAHAAGLRCLLIRHP
ncbi:HAD-IA family hydrolase [Cyanobium sp. Morenito 9A2]|uniref:HAD-IA family hydrolase n=1 Tax=Cyanobium sp. Morenito 9A2 TaxID=2823718 RepID=UPI0020CC9484|nr:HAD-IA family hydrolase [Cyanobium sp. Morenito 9A2]MCP9849861.1 HAD-IA family hydrolase [Cyanobium sp. Morenito 9A2]